MFLFALYVRLCMANRLTRPQVQRFLILCQLNDTYTPTLFKNMLREMMKDKLVEFKNENFVITDKGRSEMERLIMISGERESNNGKRNVTPVGGQSIRKNC